MRRLLTTTYPFGETNNNVLYDYEINDFIEIYGITGAYSMFANEDLIWFEDSAESVYIWSRVEALVNYLFHEDNLFYVHPYTHELTSVEETQREASEGAKNCEYIDLVITKDSLKPLRGKSKKAAIKSNMN